MSEARPIAIVTGGAGGLGAALCSQLVAAGTHVVCVDIDRAALAELSAALGSSAPGDTSGGFEAVPLDVGEPGGLEELVDSVVDRFGRLDLMINNAGAGSWGEVQDFSEEDWRRVFELVFWSVLRGSRAAYTRMIELGSGQIVNVASLAGLLPAPTVAPYAAAKHAVVGFSLALRAEAEDLGIGVSTVCPGPIRTGFHAALFVPGEDRPAPPGEALTAEEAAIEILAGVRRNERLIVLPARARKLLRLWRFAPGRVAKMNRETIRRLRARRKKEASAAEEPSC